MIQAFPQTVRDRLQNSANGSGTVCGILQTVPDRLQKSSKAGGGLEKTPFFKVFCPFCVPFFAFSSIVCT